MKNETKHTLAICALLILLFGIIKHAARLNGSISDIGFMATMLFQLYVPVWLIRKEGRTLAEYNISSYGLLEFSKVHWKALWLDMRRVLTLCLITFVPFSVGYYYLQVFLAGQNGLGVVFEFALPPHFLNLLVTSFLLVALPEEVFYRGFVQTRLLKQWPHQRSILGVPVGTAIIVTSALFALGHFIGEYQIGRLMPFFPAFLFSFLVFRSRSIFGAVVFHALCNIFAQLLHSSYLWK